MRVGVIPNDLERSEGPGHEFFSRLLLAKFLKAEENFFPWYQGDSLRTNFSLKSAL